MKNNESKVLFQNIGVPRLNYTIQTICNVSYVKKDYYTKMYFTLNDLPDRYYMIDSDYAIPYNSIPWNNLFILNIDTRDQLHKIKVLTNKELTHELTLQNSFPICIHVTDHYLERPLNKINIWMIEAFSYIQELEEEASYYGALSPTFCRGKKITTKDLGRIDITKYFVVVPIMSTTNVYDIFVFDQENQFYRIDSRYRCLSLKPYPVIVMYDYITELVQKGQKVFLLKSLHRLENLKNMY